MKKSPVGCRCEAGWGAVVGGEGSVFSTELGARLWTRFSQKKKRGGMERPILLHPGCRPTVWTDKGLVHWRLWQQWRWVGQEIYLTEQAVQAINRLNSVVLCGDLTHSMSATPWRKEQTENLQRVLRIVDREILLVLVNCNHDVGNIPTPETTVEF